MSDYDLIAKAIEANVDVFRVPGALAVRPGYLIGTDGFPSATQAIIVTVSAGFDRVAAALPAFVAGLPLDVRTATAAQELQLTDPAQYAARAAQTREELIPPVPRQQIALVAAESNGVATAAPTTTKVQLTYTAPGPPITLDPVTAMITVTCSVSPDNGWDTLQAFLNATETDLTVAMYDFTSQHVEAAVATALAGKPFALVLDHPALDDSADETDEQTVALLESALTAEFTNVWALSKTDPLVDAWIFQSAYHIKVAVQDDERFWLSSGNWNNSNQPIFNYLAPDMTLAQNSDRDWHVVVDDANLAQMFKAFIENDFNVAAQHQVATVASGNDVAQGLPSVAQPAAATFKQFFPAQTFTESVTITPLLTPDPGIYVQRILGLIGGAQANFWMQTQYITSFAADADFAALIDALASAQKRGVDVRLIMSQYQTEAVLEEMQNAGVAVDATHVRIQNRVHNKGMLVDGHLTVVSSQNWSGAGVLYNRDAGLIIDSAAIYTYFAAVFQHDWDNLATAKPVG